MLPEWKKVSAEQITTCQVNSKFPGIDLRPDDVVIQNMKIDWAMKDKNPVDHVYFFQVRCRLCPPPPPPPPFVMPTSSLPLSLLPSLPLSLSLSPLSLSPYLCLSLLR